MFILTENEVNFMVSQNVIPSKKHLGGAFPYVFTEQGVANLSSILNSDTAIEINIQIMRAFIAMRRFFASNAQIFQRLDRTERMCLVSFANGAAFFAHGAKNNCGVQTQLNTYN